MKPPRGAALWALIAFIAGSAILAHQVIFFGRIDVDQILHHEWFAAVLISFAIGITAVIGISAVIHMRSRY
jgi:hypothetical protein